MPNNKQQTVNDALLNNLTEKPVSNLILNNNNLLEQNALNNLIQQQILNNYLVNSQNIQQQQQSTQNLLNFSTPILNNNISKNLLNLSMSSLKTNLNENNQSVINMEQKTQTNSNDFIRFTNTLALTPEAKLCLLDPRFQQFLVIVRELEQTMFSQNNLQQTSEWSAPTTETKILTPAFETINATSYGGFSLAANLNRVINLQEQTAGNINS